MARNTLNPLSHLHSADPSVRPPLGLQSLSRSGPHPRRVAALFAFPEVGVSVGQVLREHPLVVDRSADSAPAVCEVCTAEAGARQVWPCDVIRSRCWVEVQPWGWSFHPEPVS